MEYQGFVIVQEKDGDILIYHNDRFYSHIECDRMLGAKELIDVLINLFEMQARFERGEL